MLFEKLTEPDTAVTTSGSELGRAYHNIGSTLQNLGKLDQALEALKKSLALRQRLLDEAPSVTRFQRDVAGSHGDIGVVLAGLGRPAEAASAYERSLEIYRKLAAANPEVSDIQGEMAVTYIDIGSARQNARQGAEAAKAYRQVAAILERLPALRVEDYYNIACVHARLAGLAAMPGSTVTAEIGQSEADRAMSWLKRAVAKGYHNLALIRRDTDLSPLRARPDFQLFIMDLTMPEKLFVR